MTIDQNQPRGSFNRDQTRQLLAPINPKRVVPGTKDVKPHLSQQDVLAHLTRVLGFGHFDVEVLTSELLYLDSYERTREGKTWTAHDAAYRALVRLHVRDEQQRLVAFYDGGSTGEAQAQRTRGDAHDLAFKSALSTATKRAAIALGDQFGLSLYNKGSLRPIVLGTLVGSTFEGIDVQEEVEQQEVDGGREVETAGDGEQLPEAPAERTKPTTGTQGTKRRARKPAEPKPQAEGPVNPPDEIATGPEEPTALVAGEPIQDGPMAGIVPSEAQVAATPAAQAAAVVEQIRETGADVAVADAIASEPIPEPTPEPEQYEAPEDEYGPAVLADAASGEVSAVIDATPQPEPTAAPEVNSPEEWADWAWTEAQRRGGVAAGEYPHNADLAALVYESARDRNDMQALWKMAEQRNVLTTEFRMSLIAAGRVAQDRHDQAASA